MQKNDQTLKPCFENIMKNRKEGHQTKYIINGEEKYKLLVPKNLRNNLMSIAHDAPMSGHLGNKKTSERITSTFSWPRMGIEIRNFCESCDVCQKTMPKGRVKKTPLGKMPLIDVPFKRIGIDLIGAINPPSEEGHKYILTVIDYATRYPEAKALKNIDMITIAEALLEIYIRVGIAEEVSRIKEDN